MDSIPLPVPPCDPLPLKPSPVALSDHIWADDRYPYLALVPETPFVGSLMSRFSTFNRHILVHGSSGWHLPKEMGKDWKILEKALFSTGEALLSLFKEKHPDIQCIWTLPEKPSIYGYFHPHKTQNEAFNTAKDSIDGFILYTAYITFLIGLFQACNPTRIPYTIPELLKQSKNEPHPAWAAQLEQSEIGTLNSGCRRVGAIIDISQCRWRNLIPYMIKMNLPLWFYWGIEPFADVSGTWATHYLPNPTVRHPDTPQPALPVISLGYSQVEPHGGQRAGETMEAFFAKRATQYKEMEARETIHDKMRRQARTGQNGKKNCPERKGPKTYQWVEKNGTRTRREVPRKQVDDIWNSYQSHQIKYDPFSNQFDVCSDFDDGPVEPNYDSDDNSDIFGPHSQPLATVEPAEEPLSSGPFSCHPSPRQPSPHCHEPSPHPHCNMPSPCPHSEASSIHHEGCMAGLDLEQDEAMDPDDLFAMSRLDILSHCPIVPTEEPKPQAQFIDDLVYFRYGFCHDGTPYNGPVIVETIKDWNTVCRAVGGQHLDFSPNGNQQEIKNFLNILAGAKEPFHRVPSQYWDLNPQNPALLGQSHVSHFCLELKIFDGEDPLCLLHPRGLEPRECPPWILAVPPMTALECVRRELGPNPYETAEYFIIHGMEFRTLQRLESLPPRLRPSSWTSPLGKRLAGYQYDQVDYAHYADTRDLYLDGHCHTRRALSIGGIISRFAREVLPISAILAGPSQDALDGKQDVLLCRQRMHSKDIVEVYVDDGLSEGVRDFLVGTYQQGTGTANQTGCYSWFPAEQAWRVSGYNVGHWTPECESWFLTYLRECIAGTTSPIARSKWRNSKKFTRVAPKLIYHMNHGAAEFLSYSPSTSLRQ